MSEVPPNKAVHQNGPKKEGLAADLNAPTLLVRDLQEDCKRVTAPYKYPREIEFVSELPKTRSGKIRRVELRQLELERKGATRASGYL